MLEKKKTKEGRCFYGEVFSRHHACLYFLVWLKHGEMSGDFLCEIITILSPSLSGEGGEDKAFAVRSGCRVFPIPVFLLLTVMGRGFF